jgi:hypothetical protein
MALFGGNKRDFSSIVAPLGKIEADLSSYIGEQDNRVSSLEQEKKSINDEIGIAKTEKAKSEHTVTKIAELLGSDFTDPGEDTPQPDQNDKSDS